MTEMGIDEVVRRIGAALDNTNRIRDRALVDSRQVIRQAALAVRALHRSEAEVAAEHLEKGRRLLESLQADLLDHPQIYWAGYVQDAQKEMAEAAVLTSIISRQPLPAAEDLGVESAPYLNGLAEAASELRRYILDIVRRGNAEAMGEAERALDIMDAVYANLTTVDFSDAITGGLRRTTDALRAVLERTRGDLTIATRQVELEKALRST